MFLYSFEYSFYFYTKERVGSFLFIFFHIFNLDTGKITDCVLDSKGMSEKVKTKAGVLRWVCDNLERDGSR